jgi:CheY-like chemotaxis protein
MAMLPSKRTPTVLIVEDEESMLYVLEKMLVNRGYKVLKASDGELAVGIYQRHKESIDVVFLDVGLPNLSGQDVLFKIRQESRLLKLLSPADTLRRNTSRSSSRPASNIFCKNLICWMTYCRHCKA